jgi:hypothetical protein
MGKLDLLKQMKEFYSSSRKKVDFLKIPPFNYLMIDGEGDPNTSQAYKDSVQALYSVSYGLKFAVKKEKPFIDFKVMPLEGLWWVDDMTQFSEKSKQDWKWTMMILQPELIEGEMVSEIRKQVIKKKGLVLAESIRFQQFEEGDCVQIMHLGPYSTEGEDIEILHTAIIENGFQRKGKHHEIYLNTPLKTSPENLKTIIRQPFAK